MRTLPRTSLLALALIAALVATPAYAATFSYRGELSDRGAPAEGSYGFRLSFYATQSGGMPIAPATTLDGVAVRGGTFSAELDLDQALAGRDSAWIQVEVRDAKGDFVPLAERTEVRPKETAAGICWDTQGNAGTNGATDYLGTTDVQPLKFKVGNTLALRLEPTPNGPPNVIGGAISNIVLSEASGVSIGGGKFNSSYDSGGTIAGGFGNITGAADGVGVDLKTYSAVGGGIDNVARGARSVVAGGGANWSLGDYSTAPGGEFNCAGGDYSFAGGYGAKVRPGASPASGPCAGVPVGATAAGDIGAFVWNAQGPAATTSGPYQFLVYASGGVGFNTNTVADATVSIANAAAGPALPSLRIFNYVQDQVLGGRVLISENGASSAGGYLDYDAFNNVFTIGTNTGSADVSTLRMTRGTGRVGIGRTAAANTLEVEGNASKTTATAWLANSDARIKQQIEPIENALETLGRVHPVTFRYSDAYRAAHPSIADRRYYNVLAQEFAEVFPDAVQRSGETLPGGDDEILQVDVHPALITTIAATQELAAEVRALRERMVALEAENQRPRAEPARER